MQQRTRRVVCNQLCSCNAQLQGRRDPTNQGLSSWRNKKSASGLRECFASLCLALCACTCTFSRRTRLVAAIFCVALKVENIGPNARSFLQRLMTCKLMNRKKKTILHQSFLSPLSEKLWCPYFEAQPDKAGTPNFRENRPAPACVGYPVCGSVGARMEDDPWNASRTAHEFPGKSTKMGRNGDGGRNTGVGIQPNEHVCDQTAVDRKTSIRNEVSYYEVQWWR